MTVRELKERLEQFPENCVVLVPNNKRVTKMWLESEAE